MGQGWAAQKEIHQDSPLLAADAGVCWAKMTRKEIQNHSNNCSRKKLRFAHCLLLCSPSFTWRWDLCKAVGLSSDFQRTAERPLPLPPPSTILFLPQQHQKPPKNAVHRIGRTTESHSQHRVAPPQIPTPFPSAPWPHSTPYSAPFPASAAQRSTK